MVGIRWTDYFLGGPPPPRPGLKSDYGTYLRADPDSRAWMHASGADRHEARAVRRARRSGRLPAPRGGPPRRWPRSACCRSSPTSRSARSRATGRSSVARRRSRVAGGPPLPPTPRRPSRLGSPVARRSRRPGRPPCRPSQSNRPGEPDPSRPPAPIGCARGSRVRGRRHARHPRRRRHPAGGAATCTAGCCCSPAAPRPTRPCGAAWAGATTRVLGRVGDDLQGRTVRTALSPNAASMRRSPSTARRRPARCSSCTNRGSARWSPTAARTRGSRRRTFPTRSRREPCSCRATCSCNSPGTRPASLPWQRAEARFVAVEAASWPLVEAFGADRFFEATAAATVVLANDREAEVLTRRDRRRCGREARGALPMGGGEDGRTRGGAVRRRRRRRPYAPSRSRRSTRRARAMPSTACCSRSLGAGVPTRRKPSPVPATPAPWSPPAREVWPESVEALGA